MPVQYTPTNVLRAKKAAKKLDIAPSTFYLWQNPSSRYYKPTLPRRVKLGERAGGWLEPELDEWLAARAAARSQGE
jgi:prophage regulatory protein